jgi:hypothetical protein
MTMDTKKKRNSEIRRLVLAKKLYLHGVSHASAKDKVSRILAIHHFDNAVETVLKCIATKQGLRSEGKYFYFGELLERIKDIPLKDQIRSLHEIRNVVQHQGDVPSVESVIKYRGYVEDFFRQVCSGIFNISYDTLYLSELIENEKLKEKVLGAEKAFERGEYEWCIKSCDAVLILATFDEADVLGVAGMLAGYWGASEELVDVISSGYPKKYKEKDFYQLAKELSEAFGQLAQAATGMQFLDEYRMDFLKHRQIVKNLEDFSEKELRESAELSLNFVTNLILKWQEEGMFSNWVEA